MFKRKCKIIFVRHGSTIYSVQKRLYDCEEYPPINQNGKDEMELLSKFLIKKTPNVDKIYTSSSLRAIQSSRIIARAYDMEHQVLDSLYERKSGLWGGLTFEQIEKKYPDMLQEYHKNPYEFWPDGGETTQELRDRIQNLVKGLIAENEYKTLLLVTHEGVIQTAVALILGIPPESQGKIRIPTGSATQINYFSEWGTLAYCAYVPF